MRIQTGLRNLVQYFTDAFARIFSPSKDEYPAVGVQPFEGDTYVDSEKKTL